MDDRSSADSKTLHGHSGPVYSTSFSRDKSSLLSCSEDGSGTRVGGAVVGCCMGIRFSLCITSQRHMRTSHADIGILQVFLSV